MKVLAPPLEQILKTMSAGKFIIMDLDGTMNAKACGGLASKLAQKKDVLGIMHGTCRDIEEIRECGNPVGQKASVQEEAVMILHLGQLMNQL